MSATPRKSKTAERLGTVAFMFAVTFVSISAVSALHLSTAELVRQNESLYMKRAVLEAGGATIDLADRNAVLAAYAKEIRECKTPRGYAYYEVVAPGTATVSGYVFVRDGTGLWGEITAVVGMDRALKTFTGVTFVKQNETPGLGARIDEGWFKRQFRGKTGPFSYVSEGTRSDDPTKFDAITGATITTRAVRDIMNGTRDAAASLIDKG